MKYLKLFENFNHRKPTEITANQYKEKFDMFGVENFTTDESNFLQKLIDNNKGWIYDSELADNFVFIQMYPTGDSDDLDEIQITKIGDLRYLIYGFPLDRFECDEWDEVLGYLGTKTVLQF